MWQESRAIGGRNNQRCPWRKKFEKLWSDPTSYTDEGGLTQRQVSDLFRITCLFSDRERTWILSAPGSVQVIIKAEKLHQLRPGSESSQSQALQSCWKERDMCSVALRPGAGPDLIRPRATASHYENKDRVNMGANALSQDVKTTPPLLSPSHRAKQHHIQDKCKSTRPCSHSPMRHAAPRPSMSTQRGPSHLLSQMCSLGWWSTAGCTSPPPRSLCGHLHKWRQEASPGVRYTITLSQKDERSQRT